jgi:O6-methylguanine-DNA--protein-cysteine methyltransferase
MRSSGSGEPGRPVADLEHALSTLAEPAPDDLALTILRRAGIPDDRYDRYVLFRETSHPLYVAFSPSAITGAALDAVMASAEAFEERHRACTGRAAIRTAQAPAGLRTAVRTGRTRQLRIDLSPLDPVERVVLNAVRLIPAGQLRPVSWIAREAGLADSAPVPQALARNPVQALIPCHRVTDESGRPCDAADGPLAGDLLRTSEGIDMAGVWTLARDQIVFLGSDTTRIFCHPTCSDARRIGPAHQVPFHSARDALRVGYRPCLHCRPVAA